MTADGVRQRLWRTLLSTVVAAAALGFAAAQYEFMPPGGSELLVRVMEACEGCEPAQELLTSERSEEEWREYFAGHEAAVEELGDAGLATLAGYLAAVTPLSEVPDPLAADGLPPDGRIQTLQQCTNCHGITSPITQDWEPERWIRHFERGTHEAIGLEELRKVLIANYLGHNTLSIDDVPAEIRGADPAY